MAKVQNAAARISERSLLRTPFDIHAFGDLSSFPPWQLLRALAGRTVRNVRTKTFLPGMQRASSQAILDGRTDTGGGHI